MSKVELIVLNKQVGETLTVEGWVEIVRNHGRVLFIDLRDRSAVLQLVFSGELAKKAEKLKTEDLIKVKGLIQKRPEKLVNKNISTGEIEMSVVDFELISGCALLPFEIQETSKIDEQTRLEYRYLDLRSLRMKNNIYARHRINLFFRNYLASKGFWEIETPYLTKGTPEGAREFIIPSRLHRGKFYVLPQSPQQFKQLLMVAGMEKYFQIARCFRDEDQRIDRQPEFTQLDLEMSFVGEEDILALIEEMVIELVREIYPSRNILKIPFPRISYEDATKLYKSDKPDLRNNDSSEALAFCWVTKFPLFEYGKTERKIVSCHHPFTSPVEEDLEKLDSEPLKVKARAYDLVLNGYEVGGGSIRIINAKLQEKIFSILGLSKEETCERFGHMLDAFKFSPPPHGGIALGLDRLISLLQQEKSIREVIAFPKTGDARDPLMGSPSLVSKKALDEAHIKLKE